MRVDVDERDVARIELGARAILRVPAIPERDLVGEVVEIGRRMGPKNLRMDDPVERKDTKILEVVVKLAEPAGLVVGQRGWSTSRRSRGKFVGHELTAQPFGPPSPRPRARRYHVHR